MAILPAALEVSPRSAPTDGVAAIVAPCSGDGYAAALTRQGWLPLAVDLAPHLRPAALREAKARGPYAHRVEHGGGLRQTVKALRALGVSAVLAGSAAGIGLAERIAWQMSLPAGDPAASLLRHDRGAQAAALARAGIPAPRSVRTTNLAEALQWAEAHPMPLYALAPAAVEVPGEPLLCERDIQISAAWRAMRREAAHHSGDAHLVLTEHLPGRHYVVNSLTRPDAHGTPDHIVTDVWTQTHTADGLLDRTDLVDRHQVLTRALSMYVLRALDTLGVVSGPVTSRVAHCAGRGMLLMSALAAPRPSPADHALSAATGRDRFTDALGTVMLPGLAQPVPAPIRREVVRVHLQPRSGGQFNPWTARILRQLPTVVAVTGGLREDDAATAKAGVREGLWPHAAAASTPLSAEIVLSSDKPEAVEADYRAIRAIEREGLHPGDGP